MYFICLLIYLVLYIYKIMYYLFCLYVLCLKRLTFTIRTYMRV